MFDKLAEGIAVEGMESLAPVLVDGMELLLDLLPPARTSCCATPSGCAPARTTWSRPARSSSPRPGPPPRPAARPRSTSAPPPTASLADVRDHARRAGAVVVVASRRSPDADLELGPGEAPTTAVGACVADRQSPRRRTAATPSARWTTCASWLRRGWRVVRRHRGPRPGRAHARAAARGRHRRPAATRRWTPTPEPARRARHDRLARARLRARRARPRVLTETDLVGQRAVDQGHAPAAEPAPARRRPAAAARRRLRRARAARRRPVRRDGAAHGGRARPASTSSSSTPRPSAASPATGCTCPPTSSTR